ncbi:hypothetical protein [Rhodococcus jostii]|uniref:hypothetical protein n=1 Tax=Rhodococcus jostii TaxID=132919 RepID=UPI0036280AC7
MTETLDPTDQSKIGHQKLAQQLLAQAKAEGVELVGTNGLRGQLTADFLETALEAEMDEHRAHLGYEKHHVSTLMRDMRILLFFIGTCTTGPP